MRPRRKQYGVWTLDPDDSNGGLWLLYDSIEEAVSEHGNGIQVYEMTALPLGRFRLKVEPSAEVEKPKAKRRRKKRS